MDLVQAAVRISPFYFRPRDELITLPLRELNLDWVDGGIRHAGGGG
jgi:hypothetical protein